MQDTQFIILNEDLYMVNRDPMLI